MITAKALRTFAPFAAAVLLALTACDRKPLYLCDHGGIDIPMADIDLDVYWDYSIELGIDYEWKVEWQYGFDDYPAELSEDKIGYSEPKGYNVYMYHKDTQDGPYDNAKRGQTEGSMYSTPFDWGWYDILAWNEVEPDEEGIYSIVINEDNMYKPYAYTNRNAQGTDSRSRTRAEETRSDVHYQPDILYAAFDNDEEFNEDLRGFYWDETRRRYIKNLAVELQPMTFIYLPQLIIHHNSGRIAQPTGVAYITGMAQQVDMVSGMTSKDTVTVDYNTYMHRNTPLIYTHDDGTRDTTEYADVIGGRCVTFGIPGRNPNEIYALSRADNEKANVNDSTHHQLEIQVVFNNGADSTLVFDVTDQVRQKYRGGVITVEIDMDHVPVPHKDTGSGSGFDAIVKEYEEEEHEIEM